MAKGTGLWGPPLFWKVTKRSTAEAPALLHKVGIPISSPLLTRNIADIKIGILTKSLKKKKKSKTEQQEYIKIPQTKFLRHFWKEPGFWIIK